MSFKVGDKVEQTSGSYAESRIGWTGVVKKINVARFGGTTTYDVAFTNYPSGVLRINTNDLTLVSKGKTSRLEELIAQVNAARPAIIALRNEFSGQVYYNSPKFKKGEEHLCETFTRLHDFELTTKTAKKTFNTFIVGNNQRVNIEGDRLFVGTTSLGLIGDIQFELGRLISGDVNQAAGLIATRSGLSMSNGVRITWDEAERIASAIAEF